MQLELAVDSSSLAQGRKQRPRRKTLVLSHPAKKPKGKPCTLAISTRSLLLPALALSPDACWTFALSLPLLSHPSILLEPQSCSRATRSPGVLIHQPDITGVGLSLHPRPSCVLALFPWKATLSSCQEADLPAQRIKESNGTLQGTSDSQVTWGTGVLSLSFGSGASRDGHQEAGHLLLLQRTRVQFPEFT